MKRKALGRGLDALIPGSERAEPAPTEIDLDRIDPNPHQPRLQFDEERLNELAASIRENGVLQPVLVRRRGDRYQLVAGERRLSGAQRAGLLKIPAVIRDVADDKLLELALVENIQREQLNAIEEAQAFQALIDRLGLTQEDLAERLGKDRSTIANGLRLLRLPPDARQLVADGKLSAGHARALLAAELTPGEIAEAAATMVREGWSVRDAERWATRHEPQAKPDKAVDPNVAAAAERLCRMFGTKVEIQSRRRGAGTIRIHFYSDDDLVRIYSLLGKPG